MQIFVILFFFLFLGIWWSGGTATGASPRSARIQWDRAAMFQEIVIMALGIGLLFFTPDARSVGSASGSVNSQPTIYVDRASGDVR